MVCSAKKRQLGEHQREEMGISCAQLARDVSDLEGAFKRDCNELRRNYVMLDQMKENIY